MNGHGMLDAGLPLHKMWFVVVQSSARCCEGEYFIDLMRYHRRLKCLVVLELKIGEFLPEYVFLSSCILARTGHDMLYFG